MSEFVDPNIPAESAGSKFPVAWPTLNVPVDPDLVLEGRDVVLTQVHLDGPNATDIEEMLASVCTPDLWEHVPGRPESVADLRAVLARDLADPTHIRWIVRAKSDGRIIGRTSTFDLDVTNAKFEIGHTTYAREAWGSSVNPDTKLTLLSWGFEQLQAGRIQFKTDVRNLRSRAAIARIGAQFEGSLRRFSRRDDGTMRDAVIFSIIADEWPSVSVALRERLDATPAFQ